MKYPMLYPRELRPWNPVFSLVKSRDFLWFPVFPSYHYSTTSISLLSLLYHDMMIYINNYILGLSENHHTILYTSYITILLYNYFIIMISLWNSSATESSTIGGHFYDSTALTTDPWLTITHLGERCFTESIKVPNRAIKNTKSDWFLYGIILYTY